MVAFNHVLLITERKLRLVILLGYVGAICRD